MMMDVQPLILGANAWLLEKKHYIVSPDNYHKSWKSDWRLKNIGSGR